MMAIIFLNWKNILKCIFMAIKQIYICYFIFYFLIKKMYKKNVKSEKILIYLVSYILNVFLFPHRKRILITRVNLTGSGLEKTQNSTHRTKHHQISRSVWLVYKENKRKIYPKMVKCNIFMHQSTLISEPAEGIW